MKSPLLNIQRDGTRTVFTSHSSATMRYFMTPESEIRVLTPYVTIIDTESRSFMAGAICSFSFLHDDMVIAVKAINTDRRDKRWLCVFILLAFVFGGGGNRFAICAVFFLQRQWGG